MGNPPPSPNPSPCRDGAGCSAGWAPSREHRCPGPVQGGRRAAVLPFTLLGPALLAPSQKKTSRLKTRDLALKNIEKSPGLGEFKGNKRHVLVCSSGQADGELKAPRGVISLILFSKMMFEMFIFPRKSLKTLQKVKNFPFGGEPILHKPVQRRDNARWK